VERLDPALQILDLRDDRPRLLLIAPQGAVGHDVLELGQAFRLAFDVKENSAGHPVVASAA
jgi:hypothetical protein